MVHQISKIDSGHQTFVILCQTSRYVDGSAKSDSIRVGCGPKTKHNCGAPCESGIIDKVSYHFGQFKHTDSLADTGRIKILPTTMTTIMTIKFSMKCA